MTTPTPIPPLYRTFFTTLDPLLATSGLLLTLLSPKLFLRSYFPHPTLTPETRFSLDANAGFFASTLLLQVYLLRLRPNDIGVWKALEAAVLLQDIAFVLGFLRVKGGAGMGGWDLYEWANLAVLGAVAGVRGAFLLGVGVGGGRKRM